MSIIDSKLLFGIEKTLASISASSNSYIGDTINFGAGRDFYDTALTPDVGEGGNLWLTVYCDGEDFASAGSPVVTIDLHASAASSMGSPSTLLTFVTDKTPNDGDVIGRAKLPAGTIKQYVGLNVATTNALTGGKISAWISMDSETPK